jgi:two-component system chemotaxis response regulator CheY
MRILLVDDSPVMRAFLRRAITIAGLPVDQFYEAGTGQEALDLLRVFRADLILTDINMPVMDGEEMLETLKRDPRRQRIPVVVVSTDATASRMDRLMKLGAAGYLTKPFQPQKLSDLVETLADGGQ